MDKQGDLEVWYIGSKTERRITVKSVDKAMPYINEWTKADLKDDSIVFNSMGLEIYDNNGLDGLMWQEYYNDSGLDIEAIMIAKEIIDSYPNGVCPDCLEKIPEDVSDEDGCDNCGHVFSTQKEND